MEGEMNMKNKKKILGVIAGIFVVAIAGIIIFFCVYGKSDDKKDALKTLESFFMVSDSSCLNKYLQYNDFEKMFYENDLAVIGEVYEKVAGITIQADLEGYVDKSHGLVQTGLQAGLGGIPFADFTVYSDDSNLYGETKLAEDKLMLLNYTQDLETMGERMGLSSSDSKMLQKAYIEFFQYLVSTEKNNMFKDYLDNKQIRKDLLEIYVTMKVEKVQGDTGESNRAYRILISPEKAEMLLSDLGTQFPEFEDQGYKEILDKFVSSEGFSLYVSATPQEYQITVENEENGYKLSMIRKEQEKEGNSGFSGEVSAVLLQGENSVFDGNITMDYDTTQNKVKVNYREEVGNISGSFSGKLTTSKKDKKFSLYLEEMKFNFNDTKLDLRGNLEVTYGDFTVTLPEAEKVDILHGDQQQIQELKSQIRHSLAGRAGKAVINFLKTIGINL